MPDPASGTSIAVLDALPHPVISRRRRTVANANCGWRNSFFEARFRCCDANVERLVRSAARFSRIVLAVALSAARRSTSTRSISNPLVSRERPVDLYSRQLPERQDTCVSFEAPSPTRWTVHSAHRGAARFAVTALGRPMLAPR